MRWLIAFIAAWIAATPVTAADAIRITTWNLKWFPSGKANLRDPIEENRRITAAADVLRGIDPDVVLLQEVRDWESCERLVEALQPSKYQVLVCSTFREGVTVGWQQEAIISKRPARASWSEAWKSRGHADPPRGYALAVIRLFGKDVAFYCVYLKSNLVRHGDIRERQLNILKRELAVDQLMEHVHELRDRVMPSVSAVVVGGDFNTNRDQPDFVSERTLDSLPKMEFVSAFPAITPLAKRVTHPGEGRYPDATFDYIFSKDARPTGYQIGQTFVSDHLPLTGTITINQ
jgi:endonuclease/exonuclease/phosphatase family metal-dependent hydrolase